MDPIASGLLTNLLAAGLLRRKEEGCRTLEDISRDAEFYADIDAIETEFHCTLRNAIKECDAERETGELTGIVEHWDAVVERLEAIPNDNGEGTAGSDRLVFKNETDAVDQLAHEIAAVEGYDLERTPQLQQDLKRAVTEAYGEAVASFGERIVNAGVDEQFVTEANIEELAALDRLQDRLADLEERLTHPRFYELYRGDAAGRRRASRLIDPQALEFVPRPELEEKRAAQRLLVLGPGGSGKSRVLAELVANADSEIEHIIRPKAALQNVKDLQPLRSESFRGDVLLVWDDIHAISPETGNTVFRKAITELEEVLAPEHELHVLATARSNHTDSLPGDIEHTGSPLWSEFEGIELNELSEEAIATLFDRVLAKEGVVASEDVRTAFAEKAQATDPSPLYVTSVVETVDGVQLTAEDIEVLPEDALTIWQQQYKDIKATNDERRFVLWAVKLLTELGPSVYHHSLLRGIYAHVLDRDELTFEPPVEDLCQHQWLIPRVDVTGETVYVVHEVKAEAIDESIDGRLRAYSSFLFEAVDEYLPAIEGVEHQLHESYVATLYNRSLIWDTQALEQHCEQTLALDSECATAHTNYANILADTLDQPETAKEHYERALTLDSDHAAAHTNYANLLRDEYDAVEKAKKHYERALALDSDYANTHVNYANLLYYELDVVEKAKKHYERALTLDSEIAGAHHGYAHLLYYELDAVEKAKEHYERALTLDPNYAAAHYNYANLLYYKLDAVEKAKKYYERALALDSEIVEAHANYGNLLYYELDVVEKAKEHYDRALTLDSEIAGVHYGYAHLLRNEYDAVEEAKEHYERALALDSEFAKAHTNYAILLHFQFDRIEDAKRHYEQALTIDPDLGPALNNYAVLLSNELDAFEEAQHYFERGIAINDDPTAHYHYGCLLFKVSDAPEEAKLHLEIALQSWQDAGTTERESSALRTLVRVCRALADEAAATEYCERARTLSADDPADARWFEGVYALLTKTDCRTRYTHGLTAFLDTNHDLSRDLFELVWMNRGEHRPGSNSHDMALTAGVALAALTRHDSDNSHTCDEILSNIEPSSLSSPASILYEFLDTGIVEPLDIPPSDDSLDDLPLQTLERRAVAHLLDKLES